MYKLKNLFLFLWIIPFNIFGQTNVFFRPAFHIPYPLGSQISSNSPNYTTNTRFNFQMTLGAYVDFEKDNWGITTGFIQSLVNNSYTFKYNTPNFSIERNVSEYYSTYHIPLLAKYKIKSLYLNFSSFAQFMDIAFYGGGGIDIANYNTISTGQGFLVLIPNVKEQVKHTFLRQVNPSLNFNIAVQFYGKKRPTFRVDFFYRQGFMDFFQTDIQSNINGQDYQTTLRNRGSALGFNFSYPLRLYSKSNISSRIESDIEKLPRKDNIYPSIYIRPVIGNIAVIGRLVNNPQKSYQSMNTEGSLLLGMLADFHLSKRWTLSTGLISSPVGLSSKIIYGSENNRDFLNDLTLQAFQIPIQMRIKSDLLNFNSFAKYISFEGFSGLDFNFITNSKNFTKNTTYIDYFYNPAMRVQQNENIIIKSQVGCALTTGLGIQFYGKYRPTFKLELFYRQGLNDILKTEIATTYQNSNEIDVATFATRGSAFGVNLSYPFKIWQKNKKKTN
jgi:hypothetical protein